MTPAAVHPSRVLGLTEVDIFADLDAREMDAISKAAPMHSYGPGELLFSPQEPGERLFILKAGRVRVFRSGVDGRVLTTALVEPGTIFGEMALLGQHMYDNYAEVLEPSVVCVMSRADVQRFLMSDPRIAARISTILGTRLLEMERRLSDQVFKSVAERVASTLLVLHQQVRRPLIPGRPAALRLTHEQLATLVGTSRETATKVLGDFADRGLVVLARGRITVADAERLAAEAGT